MSQLTKAAAFLLDANPGAFVKDYLRIRRRTDKGAFERIRRRYVADEEKYSEYLRLDYFLLYNLYRCYLLGLQRGPALRILDIGCGGGYFAYICGLLGHDVQAIDVADFAVFNEMIEVFKVRRRTWRVRPLESLPAFEARFHLVTAFRTTFNLSTDSNTEGNMWGPREWEFLLDDLMENHLERAGRIYIQLNRAQKYGAFYDAELLDFFRRRAVFVEDGKILIRGGGALLKRLEGSQSVHREDEVN